MKRVILAALLFAGLLLPAHAQFNGCRAGFCTGTKAAYQGPGDFQAFSVWGSVARVFNAASANTSTNLADLVAVTGGAVVCTLRGSSTGFVDLAASYCAGTTPSAACAAASGGSCKVKKLYDQSGNANHLTQATLASMPALTFNAINGLPTMTFAGGQLLSGTNTLTNIQPYTYYAVAERTGAFTTSGDIVGTNGSDSELSYQTSTNTVGIFAGAPAATATATDSAFHVISGTFNGNSSTIVVDATTTSPGSGPTGNMTTASIGFGAFPSAAVAMTGTISEAGIYIATHNASMHANARSAYGL